MAVAPEPFQPTYHEARTKDDVYTPTPTPAEPKSYGPDPLTAVTQDIARSFFGEPTVRESNYGEHPAVVQAAAPAATSTTSSVPSAPADPELGGGVSGEQIQGGPVFRGALGSTITATRRVSPFAVLLIVGGLALLGYWAYTKYGGRLGLK